MIELETIIEVFANCEYETLVERAKQAAQIFMPLYKKIDENNQGMMLMAATVGAAISVDGQLTSKEKQFVKDVLDVDDAFVDEISSSCKGAECELVDMIADISAKEEKEAIIIFVATISACDGNISCEESEFLKKIIE